MVNLLNFKVDQLNCIELSFDEDIAILGGKDSEHAVISAVTFDKSVDVMAEKVIKEVDFGECCCIRRGHQSDIFVVGGYKGVILFNFDKRNFEILKVLTDLHTGISFFILNFLGFVNDVCIFEHDLFTVCKEDDWVNRLEFGFEI